MSEMERPEGPGARLVLFRRIVQSQSVNDGGVEKESWKMLSSCEAGESGETMMEGVVGSVEAGR
jgi:hypothetical protein